MVNTPFFFNLLQNIIVFIIPTINAERISTQQVLPSQPPTSLFSAAHFHAASQFQERKRIYAYYWRTWITAALAPSPLLLISQDQWNQERMLWRNFTTKDSIFEMQESPVNKFFGQPPTETSLHQAYLPAPKPLVHLQTGQIWKQNDTPRFKICHLPQHD